MRTIRNKGYSLVEVLVAIAILGIAVLGIGGFFVSASRSYSKVSAETSLQYEAQLTLNQIEGMLIDSTLGVSYNYVTNEADNEGGYHFVNRDADYNGSQPVVSKVLYVYNAKKVNNAGAEGEGNVPVDALLMKWVAEKKAIYYKVKTLTETEKDARDIDISGTSGWDLLAEDVAEFSVTLVENETPDDEEELATVRMVQIELKFKNRHQEYATSGSVLLRNDVLSAKENIEKIYERADVTETVITGVEVKASSYLTIPGGEIQLKAKVKGYGYPEQTIHRWVVTGAPIAFGNDSSYDYPEDTSEDVYSNLLSKIAAAGVIYDSKAGTHYDPDANKNPYTFIDNNYVLHINDGSDAGKPVPAEVYVSVFVEDNESGVVHVGQTEAIEIKYVTDFIVTVDSVTDAAGQNVTLEGVNASKWTERDVLTVLEKPLEPKSIVQLIATVEGGELDPAEKVVYWSIENKSGYIDAAIDAYGRLQISELCGKGSFDVVATLALDDIYTVKYHFIVDDENADYSGFTITTSADDHTGKSTLNRGGKVDCTLKKDAQVFQDKEVTWSLIGVKTNQGHSVPGNPVTINADGSVFASYELSYDYSYVVTVSAALKINPNIQITTKEIIIPRVSIELTPENSYTVMGAKVKGLVCTAVGLEDYEVEWAMSKDLNPNFFFTAWGNFNITGAKNANGDATATVVVGSKKDPVTGCTVKAQLKNNANYSATARLICEDIEMKIDTANGTNAISRGSSSQMQVSLTKENPNYSVSNNSVKWEILSVKVDGAVMPELLDSSSVSISEGGKLTVSGTFASMYDKENETGKRKNVILTVKATDTTYGMEAVCEVTVPYSKVKTGKVVSRASSVQLEIEQSAEDVSKDILSQGADWEVVNVKVGGEERPDLNVDEYISISETGKLTLGKEFAEDNNQENVIITVRALYDEYGVDAVGEVTVPYMTFKDTKSSLERGKSLALNVGLSVEDSDSPYSLDGVDWEITGIKVGENENNNPNDVGYISISETGELTLAKAFAIEHYQQGDVRLTVKATDEEHNLEATHEITVPAVTLKANGYAADYLIVSNTTTSKTTQYICSAAIRWELLNEDGTVVKTSELDGPFSVTTSKNNLQTADEHKSYIVRAHLPEDAGYLELKLRNGWFTKAQIDAGCEKLDPTIIEEEVVGGRKVYEITIAKTNYFVYSSATYPKQETAYVRYRVVTYNDQDEIISDTVTYYSVNSRTKFASDTVKYWQNLDEATGKWIYGASQPAKITDAMMKKIN